ncbi:MAG: MBL fold metallo-hydrolase [Clostridia bacterium]|nr:MBL fold metallo-hydrolase [Clostridia bacterium]
MLKFCTLFSGSSGNCAFIGTDRAKLLVDAGVTAKSIEHELGLIGEDPGEVDAILITHEHIDHIRGAGVLARRYGIKIIANDRTWRAMDQEIGKTEPEQRIVIDASSGSFYVGGLEVSSFTIPHDAADPVGYTVSDRRHRVTVATDTGFLSPSLFEHFKGSDAVLIEANHDLDMLENGPYPRYLIARIRGNRGHLSNVSCGELASKLALGGTRAIILGHLSKENNLPEVAYETVRRTMEESGVVIVDHTDVIPPDFFAPGSVTSEQAGGQYPAEAGLVVAPRYGHSKVILI